MNRMNWIQVRRDVETKKIWPIFDLTVYIALHAIDKRTAAGYNYLRSSGGWLVEGITSLRATQAIILFPTNGGGGVVMVITELVDKGTLTYVTATWQLN